MTDYAAIPAGAIKVELPNMVQLESYTCGPAALLAIFAYYGVGPEEESELERAIGITPEGSDPDHLVQAARACGLRCEEFRPMTIAQLTACLDDRRPVLLMLQAWGDPAPPSYAGCWTDGHWIVAIGYDDSRVYFEDPSMYRTRGFLTYEELDARWHDVEGSNIRTEHYGVAIWKPDHADSVFPRRARRIE